MTTMLETALVPFHGHQLLTIKDGDTIRVAMKPICEAIGLDWSAQFRRIERHAVLGTCVAVMATQLPGEVQSRDVVTLPLDYLNGWLFGIDVSRVKEEIRPKLIEYQRECFAALAAYWQQGIATNPRARANTLPHLLATHRHINSLHKALKAETNPPSRRLLHGQLEQSCRLISLPCPALEEIGVDQRPDHESPLLEKFWEAIDLLLAGKQGESLNHARQEGLLALNLPEIRAAAKRADVTLPAFGALRGLLPASHQPRFIGRKPVNSRHTGRSVRCWVFDSSSFFPS